MSTYKTIMKMEEDNFDKAMKLRTLQFDDKIMNKKDKTFKIQEEQDEYYKKHEFYKKLRNHWKGGMKDEK